MVASVRMLVFVTINALSISTILAAPAAYDPELQMKPAWLDNPPAPIITQPCSTGVRCWELLSASPITGEAEAYLLQEETSDAKIQVQRQTDREMDFAMDRWKQESALSLPGVRSSSPVARHIPRRPVKKDVFMSRSWGPGGLPFSVLYMNPHAARANNHPNNGMVEVVPPTKVTPDHTAGRSFEALLPTAIPTKHPNYRVALRNGASGQPRRQYSIIPQLFISYGWGPLGK